MNHSRLALILMLSLASEGAFAVAAAALSAAQAVPSNVGGTYSLKTATSVRMRDVYQQQVLLQAQQNSHVTPGRASNAFNV